MHTKKFQYQLPPGHRWPTLARAGTAIEIFYTEKEAEFYTQRSPRTTRAVFDFADFVSDPVKAYKGMCKVLDIKYVAEKGVAMVENMQAKRAVRPKYLINRKLEELGIDRAYLIAMQEPFIEKLRSVAYKGEK